MGLLNRIKMLWRAAVGSSYSPACDGYRPARRTLFAPRRQYPYGHPRHGAAAGKASEKKYAEADALIVEADISGNETPFSNLPTYPPLAERLSDAQLSELEARAGELGLSVGLFDSQPLWQVAMVLQATRGAEAGAATGLRHRLSVADGRPREQHSGDGAGRRRQPNRAAARSARRGDGAAGGYADPLAHQRPFTAGHDRLVAGATAVARRGIAADDL